VGERLAMSHLLEQGYKHIGHISGPLEWWEARQRMKAWKDALQEGGVEFREDFWVEGNWSSASGTRAAEKLFEQYTDMDAILVANDQMALGAMQIAHQKGLRIPQDIGITGFDNLPESAFFGPPLTTVNHDQYNLGKLAVEEIIKIIESGWDEEAPTQPKSIILEPALIVRASSLRMGYENK
jgi:LacI family transcriptional regulator